MGSGSGIRKKPMPDSGVQKAPDPGSATLDGMIHTVHLFERIRMAKKFPDPEDPEQ
jgi:hypothetical protein